MPASIRTLSQLPEITSIQLTNKSRFEVSWPVDLSVGPNNKVLHKFASKSISAGAISEKICNDMRQDLIDQNGITEQIRVDDLCSTVSSIIQSNFTFIGEKTFLNNPKINNSPLSGYSLSDETLNDYSINYETLKRFTNINSSPTIGPNFGFITRLSGFQSGSNETERLLPIFKPHEESGTWRFSPEPYFLFNSNTKNLFPNEYIFKIKRGERTSDSWKAPASGIFTCYGWLDEINNPSQSNESRWVALMGKQSQIQEWTILQVQPFIKNNYISYVGFTFPVKKGMELKVVTGFAVGSNSDKYFASNSSIANHIGNAFLGGVYTGLSAWNEDGENYATEEISNDYITSSDFSALLEHEAACDLSVKERIDELSAKVDEGYSINELSTCVKYIDSSKYKGNQVKDGDLRTYRLYIGNGEEFGNETPATGHGESCKAGVFSNQVFQQGFVSNQGYSKQKTVEYINWSDWISGPIAQVRTYEPLHVSYNSITDEQTYHERDYTLGNLAPGTIFSEGKYLYYLVSQDCTLLIRMKGEWSDGTDVLQCWMLYQTENGFSSARVINVGSAIENFAGHETQFPITIPVKKGTIMMFGIYKMLEFTTSELAQFSEKDKIQYWSFTWSPYVAASNMNTDTLYNLVNDDKYRKLVHEYGSKKIKKATIRLNVDFSNWKDIYYPGTSSNPNDGRYNLSGKSFGDIVSIFELP